MKSLSKRRIVIDASEIKKTLKTTNLLIRLTPKEKRDLMLICKRSDFTASEAVRYLIGKFKEAA